MDTEQGGAPKTEVPCVEQALEYDVLLKFSILDTRPLWEAAAHRLQEHGLDMEEIADTIGPAEDPAVQDCLIALTIPQAILGSQLEAISVQSGKAPTPPPPPQQTVSQEQSTPKSSLALETIAQSEPIWRPGLDRAARHIGRASGVDYTPALPN